MHLDDVSIHLQCFAGGQESDNKPVLDGWFNRCLSPTLLFFFSLLLLFFAHLSHLPSSASATLLLSPYPAITAVVKPHTPFPFKARMSAGGDQVTINRKNKTTPPPPNKLLTQQLNGWTDGQTNGCKLQYLGVTSRETISCLGCWHPLLITIIFLFNVLSVNHEVKQLIFSNVMRIRLCPGCHLGGRGISGGGRHLDPASALPSCLCASLFVGKQQQQQQQATRAVSVIIP